MHTLFTFHSHVCPLERRNPSIRRIDRGVALLGRLIPLKRLASIHGRGTTPWNQLRHPSSMLQCTRIPHGLVGCGRPSKPLHRTTQNGHGRRPAVKGVRTADNRCPVARANAVVITDAPSVEVSLGRNIIQKLSG